MPAGTLNYFVIGDEDTVLGFALAGVQGYTVSSRDEAVAGLEAALKDECVGIILITERIAELIRDEVDNYVFSRSFPLIVEIADRLGPVAGRPGLREMVNQAIGIKL
jgi:V/A-type H+-transporting ATPase subunit F